MDVHGTAGASRFRVTLRRGLECGVAYAAVVNILTFLRPALAGSPRGSLSAPFVLYLLVAGFGVLATFALALALAVTSRCPIRGFSRLSAASLRSCGALGLGISALVLGVGNGQDVLVVCAALAIGVALVAGYRATRRPDSAGTSPADALTAVLLLAVVPYVAESRPFGWEPVQTGLAAAVVVVIAHLRYREPLSARLPVRIFAAVLAFASAVGLVGPLLLRARPDPTHETPVVRRASAAYPNVVLIVMDTVRADHTSLVGYSRDTTPTLRAEWRRGATLYTRAIATADWTVPSTASLVTGLLASHHGAIPGSPSLQATITANVPTLAERLRAVNFRTYGVVANYANLRPSVGFARGFDYYSCRPPAAAFGMKPYLLPAAVWRWRPLDWRRETRTAADLTTEGVRLLRDAGGKDAPPLFLFLNYMDAHVPYVPPEEYRAKFGAPRPRFLSSRYEALKSEVLSGSRHVQPNERSSLEADYDAGIAYIDDSLRRLFDQLRELELFDSSLIIVTSDHGEMFGESDIVGHGAGLFPELVHVPLLVKYPGQRHAATVEDAVSGADIVPTVLAAVGLAPASGLDGRSVLDVSPSGERVSIAESFELETLAKMNPRFVGDERASFVGPLVYRALRDGNTVSERWQADSQPDSARSAPPPRTDLFALLSALAESSHRPPLTAVGDTDVMDGLRALGYLGR